MSGAARSPHYPVFLDLTGRLCVVVGGGRAAERRARSLVACGADVVVVTAGPSEELLEMCAEGTLTIEQRGYVRGDLEGAFLVFCVGCSDEIAAAVRAEADERNCLVNVSDAPRLTSFLVPSVVDRGALRIAVSTGGVSPEAARRARAAIAATLGDEWTAYVALAAEVRALVFARPGTDEARALLLHRLAAIDLPARIAAGETPTAKGVLAELESAVDEAADAPADTAAPDDADVERP
ncbi:MAG TPA: bifunctional precorrin-2 dehydrogenase/sirohydrochlorin ferrochelatase [Coriobacteriia bacterium]